MTRHQDGKTSTSPQQHRLLGEEWGKKLSLCFSSAGNGENLAESKNSSNIDIIRAQQARLQCG